MSRLKHSSSGYFRLIQMSRAKVFLFVEGPSDTYFYDKMAASVYSPKNIPYTVYMAQQLPGTSGGKTALIGWFRFLRRRSALVNSFKEKTTVSIFFLDKDVDDFLRVQRRSDHIVYTKYYDVENHIFREGDLGEAVSAIARIDRQLVLTIIGNYEDWRRSVAENWKDWVKLCLFAKKRAISGEFNYGRWSSINSPFHGPLDPIAYTQHLQELKLRSGLSNAQFRRAFRQISKVVDVLYAQSEYDHVFKGKWYARLLIEHLKTETGIPHQHFQGLPDRLPSSVALTLDYSMPWTEHFKVPLRRLINLL